MKATLHDKQERQCTYNVTLTYFRVTIVAVKKQLVLYMLIVSVALVIQHAVRMRSIISPSVTCPGVQYFSTFFHKRHDFSKKLFSIKHISLFHRAF